MAYCFKGNFGYTYNRFYHVDNGYSGRAKSISVESTSNEHCLLLVFSPAELWGQTYYTPTLYCTAINGVSKYPTIMGGVRVKFNSLEKEVLPPGTKAQISDVEYNTPEGVIKTPNHMGIELYTEKIIEPGTKNFIDVTEIDINENTIPYFFNDEVDKINEYLNTGNWTPPGGDKDAQGVGVQCVVNTNIQELQVTFRNLIGSTEEPKTKPTNIAKINLTFFLDGSDVQFSKEYLEFPNAGFFYSLAELTSLGFPITDIIDGKLKISAVFKDKNDKGVALGPLLPGIGKVNFAESVLQSMPVTLSYRQNDPDDPTDNPTIDGDSTNEDNTQDELVDDNIDNSIGGIMTTTYKMSPAEIRILGDWLWNADLTDLGYKNINNNPIENIVAIKAIPFDVPVAPGKTIKFGNIDTKLGATPVTTQVIKKSFTIKTYDIFPQRYAWMGYSNFVNFTMYLPFFNNINLATKDVYGKYKNASGWHYGCTLTINYTIDVITGDCTVEIKTSKGNVVIYSATTNIGIDVPLFATNRAAKEQAVMYATDINKMQALQTVSNAVSGALGTGSSMMNSMGSPAAMGANALTGGMNTIINANNSFKMQEINLRQAEQIGFSTSQSGAVGGSSAINITNIPYLVMHYPTYYEPEDHVIRKGRPVNKTMYIMECRGLVKMDKGLRLKNLSGATQEMKRELYDILTSGFYATYPEDKKYLTWDEEKWINEHK